MANLSPDLPVMRIPDDRYMLGETPEIKNLFVATGFNSIGIQSSGGVGKVMAQWVKNNHPPIDLADVDIRRMSYFQNNKNTCMIEQKKAFACFTPCISHFINIKPHAISAAAHFI